MKLCLCPGLKLRDIASISGKFTWGFVTVAFAQAHFRSLQCVYINSVKHLNDISTKVSLSTEATSDLLCWVTHLKSSNRKGFSRTHPCKVGMLSVMNLRPRGPWPHADRGWHINELELLSALYGLQTFTDKSVLLFLDDCSAVSYINKCGDTRSLSVAMVAKKSVWGSLDLSFSGSLTRLF